jgi:hypothetical protein
MFYLNVRNNYSLLLRARLRGTLPCKALECDESPRHLEETLMTLKNNKRAQYIDTTWELRRYDVWGNAKDGFDVNDLHRGGEVTIRCKIEVNNAGTPQEFLSASPSDSQIRKALGLGRFKIETDGDDLTIYVNRARDGYPCGELYCTSHESLSPIRAKGEPKTIVCPNCKETILDETNVHGMVKCVWCHRAFERQGI